MKLVVPYQHDAAQLNRILSLVGLFAFTIMLLPASSANAQLWPAHQSPVVEPVPQYVSPGVSNSSPLQRMPAQQIQPAPGMTPRRTISVPVTNTPVVPNAKAALRLPAKLKPNAAANKLSQQAKKKPENEAGKLEKTSPTNYGLDYSVYRDRNRYPIDYRKPCHTCGRPIGTESRFGHWGNNGRPYHESEPGGCLCNKEHAPNHPKFSIYWPRPFSVMIDDHHPDYAAERYLPGPKDRIVDVFNSLSTFKLSSYKRTDNGYCGPGVDPFGCLGESKQQSNAAMVGYPRVSNQAIPGLGQRNGFGY